MGEKPNVIMMYGYPATGKTFLAKKLENFLSKKYKVASIATLDFRKKLNLFDLESEEQREMVYNFTAEKIAEELNKKYYDIIIIDGNFNKKSRREKIYSIIWESEIYLIHCFVSNEEIIKERMEKRQKEKELPENKASTMELYHLIKYLGEDINGDEIIASGRANLILFNSEKNVVEHSNFDEASKNRDLAREIISICENNS